MCADCKEFGKRGNVKHRWRPQALTNKNLGMNLGHTLFLFQDYSMQPQNSKHQEASRPRGHYVLVKLGGSSRAPAVMRVKNIGYTSYMTWWLSIHEEEGFYFILINQIAYEDNLPDAATYPEVLYNGWVFIQLASIANAHDQSNACMLHWRGQWDMIEHLG